MGDDSPLPCSPASRVLFTTTSASSSRRSLTRLSTRCVKRTSCRSPLRIGREMNVFCEAEGSNHRLSFKSSLSILLYPISKQLTTMSEHHYRADWLDITLMSPKTTLDATVKALCDKAEQMVRNAPCCWVLSDRNIGKNRLPVPAPMAAGAVQTRLRNKACAATPTSS